MLDLGIIIVNWNTCDYLARCLETVFKSQGDFTYQVVVVDNASTDGSCQMVQDRYPQATLVALEANMGYPKGNNVGLHKLGFHGIEDVTEDAPRYALLLNPDTEVPEYALFQMVQFMDQRPEVGVAGPQLVLEDGSLDRACRRGFPTPTVSFYHYSGLAKAFPKSERFGRYNMTFADRHETIEVDAVVGAYMQVRKECIAEVGLMDEQFFMYAEDLDWCYRIKQRGWHVWYNADVVVHHIKRAASRKSSKAQFEFWRAMLLFYRKHFRESTPMWMHFMILSALLIKGGSGLWPEIRHPSVSPMKQ